MIFIASPYSSVIENAGAEENRYLAVKDFVKFIIKTQGPSAFSPIVYAHHIAAGGQLPGDADYWYRFNLGFLRMAEALFVLQLPGWEMSKGVSGEIALAKKLGIGIYYYRKIPNSDSFEEVEAPNEKRN